MENQKEMTDTNDYVDEDRSVDNDFSPIKGTYSEGTQSAEKSQYSCNICGKTYKVFFMVERHMNTVHTLTAECPICEVKIGSGKRCLRVHLQRFHNLVLLLYNLFPSSLDALAH
jgi:Zinc finger, C2H2 type